MAGREGLIGLRFNGLDFTDDMRLALQPDGASIAFTRQERLALIALTRRPGALVPRDGLHAAIAGPDAGSSARNVDFLVNRLRRKLGDDPRQPRFIATQYGEGYVWVAAPDGPEAGGPGLVAVGPVRGREARPELAEAIARGLAARLAMLGQRLAAGATRFEIEAGLSADSDGLHCAFALRELASGQILAARRMPLDDAAPSAGLLHAIADWAHDAIWQHMSAATAGRPVGPADLPLELQLHQAAQALWRPADAWRETEAQLRRAREDRPDDPRAAIMWGLGVYARIVQWPPSDTLLDAARREAFFGELQEVVLGQIGRLDDNPLLKLGAAKLLWLAGPQHMQLAERLADEAHAGSTAFAAAHATRGQILMLKGEIAEGLALLKRASQMAQYGSDFHVYLLALECGAHLADGDRRRLRAALAELALARPDSGSLALFMLPEDEAELSPFEAERIAAIPAAQFRLMIDFFYQANGRWFMRPEHRANFMRGLVRQARRLHGADVVPPDVARIFVPMAGG